MSLKQNDDYYIFAKIKPYIKASIIGVVVFAFGISLSACILLKTNSESEAIKLVPYIFLALGSFAAGVSAHKILRGRGFLNGLSEGAVLSAIVFLTVSICLNFEITAKLVLIIPVCLISGFLGGITAANTKI